LYLHMTRFPRFPIGTISVYWIVKSLESIYLTGSVCGCGIIEAPYGIGAC